MPCNDITEVIDLHVDAADRLRSYKLNKLTCGAEIGSDSLLLSLFINRRTDEILALEPTDVASHFDNIPLDENGHGTLVSSVIAASLENGEGVLPFCCVTIIKCLDKPLFFARGQSPHNLLMFIDFEFFYSR